MKLKNLIKVLLCLVMILTMTGCRFSPVLQQIIYSIQANEIDHDQQQIENNEDADEKNEDLSKTEDDESEVERTPEQQAVYDEFINNQDFSSADMNYDDISSNDTQAKDNPSGGASNEGTGDQSNSETVNSSVNDNEDMEDVGDQKNDNQQEDENATRNIVDANGTTQTIPQNVEYVTAVGPAATIVEMVAGDGALIGTSANFLNNSLAKSLFNLSNVSSWWSGDGTSAISSSSFSQLLSSNVDVCFEISGQTTFTSSQISQLQSNGIGYVVLPALTTVQNLKDAVEIVSIAFGENAKSGISSRYSNWIDSTLSSASGGTACYSLYIAEWRDDVSYHFTTGNYSNTPDSSGSGSGVAIAWTTSKAEIMSAMMSKANVTNTSTAYSRFSATECVYVTPMFNQFSPTFSGNTSNCQYYRTDGIAISKDWFVTQDGTLLGSTSSFNKIIVASSTIKSKIESSYYWRYQLNENGFVNGELYSSIGGNYDVLVAPSGIDSWAEGSVESPLIALWVGNKISGSVSSSTLSSKIQDFYSTFFGKSISASQVGAN